MPVATSRPLRSSRRPRGKRMQAATIVAPQVAEMRVCPLPDPGPEQVRIRLEGSGVCASNLPVWEGRPWFQYPCDPGAPGHEGWGVVDALGAGVRSLAEGDRVAVLSYHAFAEYDVADADAVVRLPEALAGLPVPAEPLGCAINVFARADVCRGQRIAVVGVGFLGALLIQLASQRGAEVLAISRRPWSLQVARRCGASHTCLFNEPQAIASQLEGTPHGAGCERVIEATGKQIGVDVATQLVGERGKIIIAGYHQDGLRHVDMQVWNWRGVDVVNAHERSQRTYIDGMQAAVEAACQGRLDFLSLLTHPFELRDLGASLQIAMERPDGFLKAYVTCS